MQFILANPPISMSLGGGRKPEDYDDTGKTYRVALYRQQLTLMIEPGTLGLWGGNATRCTTAPPLLVAKDNHFKKVFFLGEPVIMTPFPEHCHVDPV